MEGGAKNINYKCAYMLSLDFDNGISIKDFLENAKDLGLEPTFIYETFSSTDDFNRFRAIWKLKVPIESAQLKTALQLMLLERHIYVNTYNIRTQKKSEQKPEYCYTNYIANVRQNSTINP